MANSDRKRGRPRHGSEPKCEVLTCHTSPSLRRRVEEAARRNQRSKAQEIEARLHFSFDAEEDAILRNLARQAMTQQGGEDGNR